MDKEAGCCSTHLIEGDGTFKAEGLDNFIKQVKLAECGVSYAVVAIMGPQSSGKSTLLNNLFHTNFTEMDAESERGRYQCTKGIWMARCVGIEPCTIVMDIEGTDGSERGEDDTKFEKQSALFALAVSDIVLINMWCHDIGREQAANKPLLKTVFQVMLRLFSPRKTTLMFVIRDKTKTSLVKLELILRKDIQKIWDSIPKPEAHKHTPLSDFFNVEVVALPSFETEEEKFKEQVARLRERFFHSIAPNGLAGDRRGVVPASGFSLSAQQIWKVIKENKDLDLPAHKVMVATVRCEEIANEKYNFFVTNEDWCDLKEAVQSHFVQGFGNKLSSMLEACLSSYDEEATYFEDGVRSAKRKQLEEKLIQLVQPTYQLMLEHMQLETLNKFKKALEDALKGGQVFAKAVWNCRDSFMALFDEQCKDSAIKQADWDLGRVRDKFSRDIDSHVADVQTAKLSQLNAVYESKLKEALDGPVAAQLEGGGDGTWPTIRKLYQETKTIVYEFSNSLSGFEMDKKDNEEMVSNLENFARGIVEGKTKEEAGKALYRMKERFMYLFNHDDDSMPRVWTGKEDICTITKIARSSCLKLLSILAASRLDVDGDKIYDTLVLALVDHKKDKSTLMWEPLASRKWEEVPAAKTFITPVQCKSLWSQFQRETEYTITQAIASQDAIKLKKNEIVAKAVTNVVMGVACIAASFAVGGVAVTGGAAGGVGVAALTVTSKLLDLTFQYAMRK